LFIKHPLQGWQTSSMAPSCMSYGSRASDTCGHVAHETNLGKDKERDEDELFAFFTDGVFRWHMSITIYDTHIQ
jgi:hypothetical protein